MMDWTILAAFAATTLMTAFSYLTGWCLNQPYKEPLLLAILLNNFHLTDNTVNRIIGWLLHYNVGLLFVLGFNLILKAGWADVSFVSAMWYGSIIGIIGILGWKIMFKLSKLKPQMNYIGYYIQLFIAHLIFAFTMIICYR